MPSRRTDLPLYLGLYEDIKDKIVSGELAAGEKLPSIRAMARDLRVSINTVNNAYYQLEVEGYVRPAERTGYFVEKIDGLVRLGRSGPANPERAPPKK